MSAIHFILSFPVLLVAWLYFCFGLFMKIQETGHESVLIVLSLYSFPLILRLELEQTCIIMYKHHKIWKTKKWNNFPKSHHTKSNFQLIRNALLYPYRRFSGPSYGHRQQAWFPNKILYRTFIFSVLFQKYTIGFFQNRIYFKAKCAVFLDGGTTKQYVNIISHSCIYA